MSRYGSSTQEEKIESYVYYSQLLKDLEESLRPSLSVACGSCPASMWFTTEDDLKCYCRAMNAITYSEEEEAITNCDGREQAIAALLAEE